MININFPIKDLFNPKNEFAARFDKIPDTCPFCHKSIVPKILSGYFYGTNRNTEYCDLILSCNNDLCTNRLFSGHYFENPHYRGNYYFEKMTIGNFITKPFSENINKLSKNFVEIYNQSNTAEQSNLNQIAGIGYRKSLEFLIKDFLISVNSTEELTIKKLQLGPCIQRYIENKKLKLMAERAVWLGNDETHYEKKWEDKDLTDLKKLIEVTLHYIDMELLTDEYQLLMPAGKK